MPLQSKVNPEDYSPSNPAIVPGILSPADGFVYRYAYDAQGKQITIKKIQKQAEVPHKGMLSHPVHTNNLVRRTFEHRDQKTGKTVKFENILEPTHRRLSRIVDNPVSGSHTHNLHGLAGARLRDSIQLTNPYTGQITRYDFLLDPTIRRLRALENDPVSGSHTHALYGKAGVGGLGGFTFTNGAFKTDRTKLQEDLRRNPAFRNYSAKTGIVGIGGLGAFSFADGRFKTDFTQQWQTLKSRSGFRSMGALHGKEGTSERGVGSQTNARGQRVNFRNLLLPTVRRLEELENNPVTGTKTHALYGLSAGQQARYQWENPDRFKQQLANMSGNVKSGALHGLAGNNGSSTGQGGLMSKVLGMLGVGASGWPIARFHFYVMIGGTELGFQGVEGLEAEVGVIEFRDGNSPFFGKERVPGLITYSRVTLKKGMFAGDTNANTWFKEIAQDRKYTQRRPIIIAMMDHNIVPQFIWRYEQCFLTKVIPSNLDAESDSEVAIEEIEFVGRAWYLESLAGALAGAAGSIAGSLGVDLNGGIGF